MAKAWTPEQLRNIELATVAQRLLPQGCNALGNTNRLHAARLAGLCHGLLDGLPVLICGAGPSLDRDVDALRELADRSVVVAVSTAAPSLRAKGIAIDAVVAMESVDTSRPLADLDGYASAWLDIAAHPNSWKACEGRPLLAFHGPSPEVWMVTMALGAVPIVHGGSVTTAAAAVAWLMGAREIALVGCDFAFAPDGNIYADGSGWGDERVEIEPEPDENGTRWLNWVKRAQWKVDRVEEETGVRPPDRRSLEELEGWDGSPVFATMDYVTQWIWFSKRRALWPHGTLINCSEGGAKIPGFHHMTLRDCLDASPSGSDPAQYLARLLARRPVGEADAAKVRAHAERAADDAAEVANAIMMGHSPKGAPWVHDVGVVKPFTVEREIQIMLAQQAGQRIGPAESVAQRRSDVIHAATQVNKALEPEE